MLLNLILTIGVCLIVLLHLSEGCFRHDINDRQSVYGTLEPLGGNDYKVGVGLNYRFKRHAQVRLREDIYPRPLNNKQQALL